MEAGGRLLQVVLRDGESMAFGDPHGQPQWEDEASVDWRSILYTAFAGWAVEGRLAFFPLTLETVRRFQASAWEKQNRKQKRFRDALRTGWREALRGDEPEEIDGVKSLIDFLLDELEEELRHIPADDVDPRFLPFIFQAED